MWAWPGLGPNVTGPHRAWVGPGLVDTFKEEEENPSPASSSSLRFSSEDDEGESDGAPTGRKRGSTYDEIMDDVIRDMQQAKEGGEGQGPTGMTGGPSQQAPRVNNENPYEGLMQEMIDLTGADDEEDEWKRNIEEKVDDLEAKVDTMVSEVDALVAEMTEQHAQTTKLVNLVKRMVSWMDRDTQSSNHPSPATSVAPLAAFQQPNTNDVGPSRKRKETATTNHSPSVVKRTRKPDSPGSQRGN